MSGMDEILLDPFKRLLAHICTPSVIRYEEGRSGLAQCWGELEQSGFIDALLPESRGGAGLSLSEVFPLVVACGEAALPAPFAETMVARALLDNRGAELPTGAAIVLAPPSPVVPLAAKASHALVTANGRLSLIAMNAGASDPFRAGGYADQLKGETLLEVAAGGIDLQAWAAALAAAQMSGMMMRILDMTLRYANERQQFDRPLSKFQAIQHQLAVGAEYAVSAHTAAAIAMSGQHFDPLRAAAAKVCAGEAASKLCAIAHAVHGAIGVTEEYDLQIYTRRLKQWALAFGNERYWAHVLASARLGTEKGTSADFVRLHLGNME